MIRAAGGREEAAVWSEIHQGYATSVESGIPPIVVGRSSNPTSA